VLYLPLRSILSRNVELSCPTSTPLDVVSTDFLADAVIHFLLHLPGHSQMTVHLTAGSGKSMTVGQVVDYAKDYFQEHGLSGDGAYRKRSLNPESVAKRASDQYRLLMDAYYPYMSLKREFDTQKLESILGPVGIVPKHLRDYLRRSWISASGQIGVSSDRRFEVRSSHARRNDCQRISPASSSTAH